MKKFSVSTATLALVNAAKFDTTSMNSYAEQSEKLGNQLNSQYLAAENARLDALDDQATKDEWRQDNRPKAASFV